MLIGETWAYREKPHTEGWPVPPVEIFQFGPPRSNKVRIRYLDGDYPGLDQWVPRIRLRTPWSEVDAWLRDERCRRLVVDASIEAWDSVECWAAWEVIYLYPRPDGILLGFGRAEGAIVEIGDLAVVSQDLDLDMDAPPPTRRRFGRPGLKQKGRSLILMGL